MKRITLIALLAAFAVPAHAGAATTPCRNKIFNDWYADGKIASTYPRGCYADALKHIPPDAQIYSSLADDIRTAMRASISRSQGRHVAAQVGSGFKASSGGGVLAIGHTSKGTSGPKSASGPVQTPVADTSTSDGGSSIPLPILVLGGLALALAAAGAIGTGVKFARNRHR